MWPLLILKFQSGVTKGTEQHSALFPSGHTVWVEKTEPEVGHLCESLLPAQSAASPGQVSSLSHNLTLGRRGGGPQDRRWELDASVALSLKGQVHSLD